MPKDTKLDTPVPEPNTSLSHRAIEVDYPGVKAVCDAGDEIVGVGDQKQRYEVRFTKGCSPDKKEVLGWTNILHRARNLAYSWAKHPDVTWVAIYDREHKGYIE